MVDGDVEAVDETTLVIVDWPAEDEEIVDGEDEGETFEGFCIFDDCRADFTKLLSFRFVIEDDEVTNEVDVSAEIVVEGEVNVPDVGFDDWSDNTALDPSTAFFCSKRSTTDVNEAFFVTFPRLVLAVVDALLDKVDGKAEDNSDVDEEEILGDVMEELDESAEDGFVVVETEVALKLTGLTADMFADCCLKPSTEVLPRE
ncbi:hypothetical protein QR98_0106430 [Sarcoptes scabiei]|uniref:Uncharacterized protein n=1 Tax=Sarcoptes scabiei TaxID=52283 RepID=A0A132AM23_SARSC|nr:hypothetical protein QR98_0106430 [Sarcoptes scabiei]